MSEGKYLYCITRTQNAGKLEIKGIDGRNVYMVSCGGLSAAVSDSELKEYFITRENLLAHQRVIEEISRKYSVLPVSFGTVTANAKELKEKILKPRIKGLQGLLENIDGKIELGLKAFWNDMKSIFQEIGESSPTIRNLKRSKNTSYQQKIAAGELVGRLLEEKRKEEKDKILEPLIKIAGDFKENKILGEDMVLNVAFLLKRAKEKQFDKKINELGERFDGRVRFMYVGPLPPYNFIKLELSLT